jgi:hypothetical protein
MKKSKTPFFKQTTDNMYKMMSALGFIDIHSLKNRDPEAYKRIMGGK